MHDIRRMYRGHYVDRRTTAIDASGLQERSPHIREPPAGPLLHIVNRSTRRGSAAAGPPVWRMSSHEAEEAATNRPQIRRPLQTRPVQHSAKSVASCLTRPPRWPTDPPKTEWTPTPPHRRREHGSASWRAGVWQAGENAVGAGH